MIDCPILILKMNNLQEQFSQIYDQYIQSIYRFVFIKTNSQFTAEDLTAEVFTKLWEKFQEGRKIDNPKAFLYQSARNIVIDHYRKKGSNPVSPMNEDIEIADNTDMQEDAIKMADMRMIQHGISQLKDDYQNAVIWYYLDQMPIADVAKTLNKSEGATRTMLSRAVQELKDMTGDRFKV